MEKSLPLLRRQKIELAGKRFVLIDEISKVPKEERRNYILLFFTEDRNFNAFYTDLNSNVRFSATEMAEKYSALGNRALMKPGRRQVRALFGLS